MFTLEQTLFNSITSLNVPTNRTLLRGISSVNKINKTSFFSSFVRKELFQLVERPSIDPIFLFLSEFFAVFSNVFQIFKHNCSPMRKSIYDLLRNTVIYISPETVLLHSNLLKVSFGRSCSFFLKPLSQRPVPINYLFCVSSIKKLIFRCYSNFLDTSINTNYFLRWFYILYFFLKNNTKKNFIPPDKQLSGFSPPSFIFRKVRGYLKFKFLSSINSRYRQKFLVKPNIIGIGIIPNAHLFRLWACCFSILSYPCFSSFQGFTCFVSSRTRELRGQKSSTILVSFVVKGNSIMVAIPPANSTDMVKCLCVSLNCRHYRGNICFYLDFDCFCKYHTSYINAVTFICQVKNLYRRQPIPLPAKAGSLLG